MKLRAKKTLDGRGIVSVLAPIKSTALSGAAAESQNSRTAFTACATSSRSKEGKPLDEPKVKRSVQELQRATANLGWSPLSSHDQIEVDSHEACDNFKFDPAAHVSGRERPLSTPDELDVNFRDPQNAFRANDIVPENDNRTFAILSSSGGDVQEPVAIDRPSHSSGAYLPEFGEHSTLLAEDDLGVPNPATVQAAQKQTNAEVPWVSASMYAGFHNDPARWKEVQDPYEHRITLQNVANPFRQENAYRPTSYQS